MNIYEKRRQFLTDTINYYSKDVSRRAVTRSPNGRVESCLYEDGRGERCAIGRVCPRELLDKWRREKKLDGPLTEFIFNELPIDIQDLGHCFLKQCQVLHDTDRYWDANGLTLVGRIFKNSICKDFCC